MDLVVPSAGAYTVKVVALDAGLASNRLFLVGGQFVITTNATGIVTKSLTLTPATFTLTALTTRIAIGAADPVAWQIFDPSGVLDDAGRGLFCGTIQASTSTLATDFDGTATNACTVNQPTPGTSTFAGSLPSEPAPAIVRVTLRATQEIREGATDQFLHWVHPSITRGETPLAVTVAPVATIAVTPALPTVTAGATQQMTATPRDSVNGVVTGWPVTWTSSAPAVASINATTGLLTAVANGTTIITAAAGGITGTTTVTVTGGVNVGSITVALGSTSVTGNATTLATPTVRDPSNNVIVATVTWSSSVPTVARVAANGSVQALGAGTTSITATIGNVSGAATLTVTQVAQAFNIVVRPVGSMPAAASAAFATAAARWSQVIRGDLPNQTVNNLNINACGFSGVTNITETIDDLVIYVKTAAIDGAGNTQAQGGPCYTRGGSGHAYVGIMILDQDDLASMETDGILLPVVMHEMGHVLGIGTNWSAALLPNPAPLNPDPAGDPVFVGVNAQWAFQNLGTGYGGAIVPVENCCSEGTRNAHWRETVLKRELMTGFTTGGGGLNPLSPLTVASLLDLGYVVDVSQSDAIPYFEGLPPELADRQRRVQIRELPRPITPIVTDLNGRVISGGEARVPRAPVTKP